MTYQRFNAISPRAIDTWIGAAVLTLVLTLVVLPPDRYGFYPRCAFFEATGWLCPGCGGTRAVAAMLRGDFAAAWRLNALVVALLPLALWAGFLRLRRGELMPPRAVWIGLGMVAVVFGIFRNL